jgi:hypothetical protein
MEKQNWNWKTHLLAAVLGFGVGRYSKSVRSRQNETTSINTPSSLKEMLESLINPVVPDTQIDEDEYFFTSFPPDTLVESLLLLGSLLKALAEEDGHPIQEKDFPSIDFDRVFERSLHQAVAISGYIPDEKEIGYFKRLAVIFLKNLVKQMKKAMVSGIPTVPSHVSKDVYDILERLMRRIVTKAKTEGYFSDQDDTILQLESILEKWKRELRPEPYTKILGFMLSATKT